MATSYRTYLRSVGRKPINPAKLRTTKRPGDLEIVFDHKTGEWVPYRHEKAADEGQMRRALGR